MTKDARPQPVEQATADALERADWTPAVALRFYADGKHYDVVDGRTRILGTGAVASNALKALSHDYADMKGDVALLEQPVEQDHSDECAIGCESARAGRPKCPPGTCIAARQAPAATGEREEAARECEATALRRRRAANQIGLADGEKERLLRMAEQMDLAAASLRQPQTGEAVAWLMLGVDGAAATTRKQDADEWARRGFGVQPLYSHPPADTGEGPKYKAEFLWGFDDDSAEALGYELVNCGTEGYRQEIWNALVAKLRPAAPSEAGVDAVKSRLASRIAQVLAYLPPEEGDEGLVERLVDAGVLRVFNEDNAILYYTVNATQDEWPRGWERTPVAALAATLAALNKGKV